MLCQMLSETLFSVELLVVFESVQGELDSEVCGYSTITIGADMADGFELNRFKTILISLNEVIGDMVYKAKDPEDLEGVAEDLLAVVKILNLELPRYLPGAVSDKG